MVRAALWLAQEVGEGGIFTKTGLRQAFPGVNQIDRRARDLRYYGWVINTSREDLGLTADQQRLVQIGVAVWDPAERRRHPRPKVSQKARQETLLADDFACRRCGVAAGEPFPDDALRTAKLSVARIDADGNLLLMTLCDRCLTSEGTAASGDAVRELACQLHAEDREQLLSWMRRGERRRTKLDRAWSRWRALPASERERVHDLLANTSEDEV